MRISPPSVVMGFQDPATYLIVDVLRLYDFAFLICVLVVTVVFGRLVAVLSRRLTDRTIYHSTWLEVTWTLVPLVLLLILAVPSLRLLYAIDEIVDPELTIKVIGHQWY